MNTNSDVCRPFDPITMVKFDFRFHLSRTPFSSLYFPFFVTKYYGKFSVLKLIAFAESQRKKQIVPRWYR